ncbi:MAG: peptidoglycan-binding protein [Eubacteriales bacterium]|nr:peptidoglycan-binding protein [Eubacteriales bacterium]
MSFFSIKKRCLAALLAVLLVMPAWITAFAATYPYDTVSMDSVNMRRYANTTSTILKRINEGDTVTVLSAKGSYYEIKFDGKTGYAQKKYIDGTDPSPDPSPEGVVQLSPPLAVSSYPYDTTTAGYVKFRKTASETGEVIRTLPKGSLVTVYSVQNNFARIDFEGTKGYVYSGYLNLANIPTDSPVPGATVKPDAAKYTSVKNGDTGTVVRALQEALIELGYLTGEADGKFGKNTQSALELFQKRNGLTQTGVADQELQLLLYEGTPKDQKGYRQYVRVVAPVAGALIRENSVGEAVEKAQTRLKELGFYLGAINGVCDQTTVAAISSFEARNNLSQDGTLTAADQNILYGVGAANAYTQVTPTPSPTPQIPKDTVRQNDKSDDAKLVQERLKELGYYTGNITGTFNTASVEAMKKFQKANGLTADGVCGIQSRAVLFAPHPIYAVPTAAPIIVEATVTPTYAPITEDNVVVLKAGSRGESVLRAQTRLQELGYYTSRLDGIYLTDDINAVRAFQKANKLTVDGKAGYNTQTVLYSNAAVRGDISTDTTSNTVTADSSISVVLRYGSEGTQVTLLQNRLIELGYLVQTADGKFGAATKAAVVAFQRANNLTRDGVVGTTTLAALNSTTVTDNKLSYTMLYPGAVSDAVADLQNRLITLGYLTGKADGKFGTQTSLALIAFQKANGLTADGIVGSQTVKKLNASSVVTSTGSTSSTTTLGAPTVSTVSAASVRYANWYTEIRAKVRTYPNVTVYDFTTGISWQLNIFSNGAHADAEPLTAADTANMNRAFGGKTTWTPKAVWVVLSDGTVYMASTHNTPHSPSHITSNDFNGHLCIHFPRTQAQVESIGPYATSHQKAIDLGWEATQRRAGN